MYVNVTAYWSCFSTVAVAVLLVVAAGHGLARVIADTTRDNIASQQTLIRSGFSLVATDDEPHHFEALLEIEPPPV